MKFFIRSCICFAILETFVHLFTTVGAGSMPRNAVQSRHSSFAEALRQNTEDLSEKNYAETPFRVRRAAKKCLQSGQECFKSQFRCCKGDCRKGKCPYATRSRSISSPGWLTATNMGF